MDLSLSLSFSIKTPKEFNSCEGKLSGQAQHHPTCRSPTVLLHHSRHMLGLLLLHDFLRMEATRSVGHRAQISVCVCVCLCMFVYSIIGWISGWWLSHPSITFSAISGRISIDIYHWGRYQFCSWRSDDADVTCDSQSTPCTGIV